MKDVMKVATKKVGVIGKSPPTVGEGQNVKDVPGVYKGAKGGAPRLVGISFRRLWTRSIRQENFCESPSAIGR
jgi:hypothetical protein